MNQNFCDCGIPLNLDFKLVCSRCGLAVSPSRSTNQNRSSESKSGKNKTLRLIGWIFLIYLAGALIGGIASVEDSDPAPSGIGAESSYEQNGVDDSFAGTP